MAAPIDLSVNFTQDTKTYSNSLNIVKTALKLGYVGLAINKDIPTTDSKNFSSSKHVFTQSQMEAMKFSDDVIDGLPLSRCRQKLKQYTRLSVVLEDGGKGKGPSAADKLYDSSLNVFDVISVQPTSDKTFSQACIQLPIDVISFDMTQKLNISLKRGLINQAMSRGIHFEICYSHMLYDDTARRHLITNASELVRVCKGKNIIMSSGCHKMMDLRGPMDVANLTHLFGMDSEKGKAAVTTNCHKVLAHAETRKSIKSVITVEKADDMDTVLLDNITDDDNLDNIDDKKELKSAVLKTHEKRKRKLSGNKNTKKKKTS